MFEQRLTDLGIELPPVATPLASYVPVHVAGELAFVAGQVPLEDGKPTITGRVGDDVSLGFVVCGGNVTHGDVRAWLDRLL